MKKDFFLRPYSPQISFTATGLRSHFQRRQLRRVDKFFDVLDESLVPRSFDVITEEPCQMIVRIIKRVIRLRQVSHFASTSSRVRNRCLTPNGRYRRRRRYSFWKSVPLGTQGQCTTRVRAPYCKNNDIAPPICAGQGPRNDSKFGILNNFPHREFALGRRFRQNHTDAHTDRADAVGTGAGRRAGTCRCSKAHGRAVRSRRLT